jgi:hypothetical protein
MQLSSDQNSTQNPDSSTYSHVQVLFALVLILGFAILFVGGYVSLKGNPSKTSATSPAQIQATGTSSPTPTQIIVGQPVLGTTYHDIVAIAGSSTLYACRVHSTDDTTVEFVSSSDNGTNWQIIGTLPQKGLDCSILFSSSNQKNAVLGIYFCPHTSCSSNSTKTMEHYFRTNDGGHKWTEIQPIRSSDNLIGKFTWIGNQLIYATSQKNIYVINPDGNYKSIASGQIDGNHINTIRQLAGMDKKLYVGFDISSDVSQSTFTSEKVYAFDMSTAKGSWTPVHLAQNGIEMNFIATTEDGQYVIALPKNPQNSSFAYSADKGLSWNDAPPLPEKTTYNGKYVTITPDHTWVAVFSDEAGPLGNKLYVAKSGATTWTQVADLGKYSQVLTLKNDTLGHPEILWAIDADDTIQQIYQFNL